MLSILRFLLTIPVFLLFSISALLSQSSLSNDKETFLKTISLMSDNELIYSLSKKQVVEVLGEPNSQKVEKNYNTRFVKTKKFTLEEKGWAIEAKCNLREKEMEDLLILDYFSTYGIALAFDNTNSSENCLQIFFNKNYKFPILGLDYNDLVGLDYSTTVDDDESIQHLRLFYKNVDLVSVLASPILNDNTRFELVASEYLIPRLDPFYLRILHDKTKIIFIFRHVELIINSITDKNGQKIDPSKVNNAKINFNY